jgi:hypothetical protein
MSTRTVHDRAAVVTDTIIQLIFSSPRNLRAQIEALLRHQFHEIQQEALNEIVVNTDRGTDR